MAPIPISVSERRARLARRHHLAAVARIGDVAAIAGGLVGLHSSDPVTVYLSAWARMTDPSREAVERALYDDRTVVRVLGMRRTLFVVPTEMAPHLVFGCAAAYVDRERRRLIGMLQDAGIVADAEPWLRRVEAAVLDALDDLGEAAAVELRNHVPEFSIQVPVGIGRKWGGTVGVSTRVLFLLATEGHIVRTRPRGTWLSSQYRWARTEHWLGRPFERLDPATARRALVRDWLRAFGPGTEADLKWWTGWPLRDLRPALEGDDIVEVDLDGATGYLLADDLEPVTGVEPWAALLPSLDPAVMGYRDRDWYLGPHAGPLFDRNGNAGPTVWWDGRIVGGWGQRADGELVVRLLEDVPAEGRAAIDAEADRLRALLGDALPTPRFRTPLEKELRA